MTNEELQLRDACALAVLPRIYELGIDGSGDSDVPDAGQRRSIALAAWRMADEMIKARELGIRIAQAAVAGVKHD